MMRPAFTLIELLVVITIIVVLLSLLTPALDGAIYQAELLVCATQQDNIATAMITYALDHARRYPHRGGVDGPGPNAQPHRLRYQDAREGYDDRPQLVGYLNLNDVLNDPLAQPVDLETDYDQNNIVFSGIALWAGWRYRFGGQNFAAMKKLGDHFEWDQRRYTLIASDRDLRKPGTPTFESSHPDRDGVLWNLVAENDPHPVREHNQAGDGTLWTTVMSVWLTWDAAERGETDDNFAYQDGSVHRLGDVAWNEPDLDDGRTEWVPQWSGGNGGDIQIPRQ